MKEARKCLVHFATLCAKALAQSTTTTRAAQQASLAPKCTFAKAGRDKKVHLLCAWFCTLLHGKIVDKHPRACLSASLNDLWPLIFFSGARRRGAVWLMPLIVTTILHGLPTTTSALPCLTGAVVRVMCARVHTANFALYIVEVSMLR